LTSATLDRTAGSWGTLDWTYDKIGNRLSEDRSDGLGPDTYQYTANTDGGNKPILDHIDLAVMGTRNYAWDNTGNLDQVATGTGGNSVDFTFDDASRLAAADRTSSGGGAASFLYDGRGFLRSATQTAGGTASVTPLYDSAGLLHALRRQPAPTDPVDTTYVFYLAGRPVAQLLIDGTGAETWTYLTTDHLGTPLVATDQTGAITWEGGFRPFGGDYQVATATGASENGIDLRLPGQWVDSVWRDATSGADLIQNAWRWYAPTIGRYSRPDPLGLAGGINLYGYVGQNPVVKMDPLGLSTLGIGGRIVNRTDCCVLVSENGPTSGQQQFYVKAHSTSGSHDVDAIYFNDGSALKIPDFSIYVIYDCGDLNATPTGFFSRPLLSYLHLPKYRTKPLPDRPAQEKEFGLPILPPPPTCGCP
jgi:RHS repeat-associated protein